MERNKAGGNGLRSLVALSSMYLKACNRSKTTKHCGLGPSDACVNQMFAGPVYLD